jgi:hypothetical protein
LRRSEGAALFTDAPVRHTWRAKRVKARRGRGFVKELLKSNDAVFLSWVQHVLSEAGIAHVLLDRHMSALEGSLGILPRRILVAEGDHARALALVEAGPASADDPAP